VAVVRFPLRCKEAGVLKDESGFHTSMSRLRARAPKGKRAYGKVPRNRGKNQTLIAAITLQGAMGESMTLEGATDAEAFEAYVEHFLAPSLREGQVVVLDGLGAHRTEKVRELVQARGADLLFLPSYSPDLNPIEEAFSKIKALVRKAGARMREALVEAIGRALAAVTPEDAASWFGHAGYWPRINPYECRCENSDTLREQVEQQVRAERESRPWLRDAREATSARERLAKLEPLEDNYRDQ
jgi:transposase